MPFSAKNGHLFLSDTSRVAAQRLGMTKEPGGSLIPMLFIGMGMEGVSHPRSVRRCSGQRCV